VQYLVSRRSPLDSGNWCVVGRTRSIGSSYGDARHPQHPRISTRLSDHRHFQARAYLPGLDEDILAARPVRRQSETHRAQDRVTLWTRDGCRAEPVTYSTTARRHSSARGRLKIALPNPRADPASGGSHALPTSVASFYLVNARRERLKSSSLRREFLLRPWRRALLRRVDVKDSARNLLRGSRIRPTPSAFELTVGLLGTSTRRDPAPSRNRREFFRAIIDLAGARDITAPTPSPNHRVPRRCACSKRIPRSRFRIVPQAGAVPVYSWLHDLRRAPCPKLSVRGELSRNVLAQ